MEENFDTFDRYAMNYDLNVPMIGYKYNHSYRVAMQAENIAKSLELPEEEITLASNIGLLHDIARFRQYEKYKTFNDSNSFDHALEGIKILFDEEEIKNYNIDEKDYGVIKLAIYNHNKYTIDAENMNEREIIHSKIIRDADKLDILYAFSGGKLLEIDSDGSDFSKECIEDFKEHKQVTFSNIKTKSDVILSMISLIFDLEYNYSKKRVLEEKYLDRLYSNLNCKMLFKEIIDESKNYLKGEIKNDR